MERATASASLLRMVDEAAARLERMEISCRDALQPAPRQETGPTTHEIPPPTHEIPPPTRDAQLELLQLQLQQLKRRLVDAVHRREDSDAIFQRAMSYAAAKGTANAVLHTLFDQASSSKYQVLEQWVDTGVIPTRDGLKHWRLDLREIRNEMGATVLHVAVDTSIARQNLKVKCVELLVDRVGFDVNVRDAFGRTPLHVASMAGYAEVTQALLARGADATLRDRAGLTPLSVVRTLSRPPEEIVQLLAAAETERARQFKAASDRVPPETAIASALFLRAISIFVRSPFKNDFSRQVNSLVSVLLAQAQSAEVAFDEILREQLPLLFVMWKQWQTAAEDRVSLSESLGSQSHSLVRLEALFEKEMFWDSGFVDELKIEAAAYGHSLITSASTSAIARAGATWEGLILKLIQAFKVAMSGVRTSGNGILDDHQRDAVMSETQASSISESLPSTPRSPIYADQASTVNSRQAWHYAVLFKASTQPFPGFLSVKKGQPTATCSVDVSHFFPLHDRIIIGSTEYHCVSYDVSNRVIQLDREYEGTNAAEVKAYLGGACSSLLPPYIAAKRIWEREPGNKYEDHMSNEQDLFQDYQFLDPDSEYEVAVKLGPVPAARDARSIVEEWKAQVRRSFEEKKCLSGLASCEHYCPQRSGHSLCVETMAAIGRDIAKERLGRPTYSKPLKPRASLQKYQDLYLGKAPWPGSPSTGAPDRCGTVSPSILCPDFT